MILGLRHAARLIADLVVYARRSGHLWMPTIVVLLAAATVAIVAIKTVVPAAVYVLF